MSETQSDTHRRLPAVRSWRGGFSRERKGVEAWIKLRRKWEEIVNRRKRRKGGRKGRREGKGGEESRGGSEGGRRTVVRRGREERTRTKLQDIIHNGLRCRLTSYFE